MRDTGLPDLGGTVVLVTGAGRGIGAGVALRFAEAGAAVVVHHRTSADGARAVVRGIEAGGGAALAVAADLTAAGAAERLVAAALDRFGRLDSVVANAGVQPTAALATMTADEWRTVVDTNLGATFATVRAAAAAITGGSITVVGSVEATRPAPGHAHYAVSKAGVVMLARAAALEFAGRGVRVNAVSPGLVDRPGLAAGWPDGVARWEAAVPLRRLGTARDVGDACVFLASSMASWVTGQELVVDGGMSVRQPW